MNTPSSKPHRISLSPQTEKLAVVLLLSIAAAILILFFANLPIEGTSLAIDWGAIWGGVRGGVPRYDTGMRSPVWSILPVLPLGLLSFRASWGVMVMLTLIVTILSVPRTEDRRLWWASVFLLVVSYPSIRHLADGNLEGLVIAGSVLALLGYHRQSPWLCTAGVLMASAKVQETWIFLIVLAIYTLKFWPPRKIMIAAGILLAFILPSMIYKGAEWLETIFISPFTGSIIDISLIAAINRLGLPDWVGYLLWGIILGLTLYIVLRPGWTFSRHKAGLLVAASLLLAPYAAGNSFLAVLAIGIIPLFQRYRWPGLALILLADLPILASQHLLWWQAYYWTTLLLISWVVFSWVVRDE